MSGFPSLTPAFTVRLNPAAGFQIGETANGGILTVVVSSPTPAPAPAPYPRARARVCACACTCPLPLMLLSRPPQPVTTGHLTSEPGFPTPVDAELVFGSDYVRMETSQTHVRINVNAVMQDKATGSFISYAYKGIIEVNAAFRAIFARSPDAATTGFGNSFTHVTFEAGGGALESLGHGLFVGSARFVVEGEGAQKTYHVETKVSQVVASER
ncbi:hypothetical protein BJY00DRAFT_313240 [Aspergillus carlsbadensis]|nr:hypothetical protein BJY00DRAFT_313240 [Aspergillus carlsbadensis]